MSDEVDAIAGDIDILIDDVDVIFIDISISFEGANSFVCFCCRATRSALSLIVMR